MPQKIAYETSISVAVERLINIDIVKRCVRLGLPGPQGDLLNFRAFGSDMILRLGDFELFLADSQKPARISDRILTLHYLLCEFPLGDMEQQPVPLDKLISFREMDSGMFYWEAFLSRSIRPLVKRMGNDLELLKGNLNRFDWQPVQLGDLGARIHVIGKVYVTLIYRQGDEEFPASADLLFEPGIKRIFVTEDTAVLAGRICLGLL